MVHPLLVSLYHGRWATRLILVVEFIPRYAGGGANGTTGIYAGGNTDSTGINIIAEKATSLGDFSDFGDLSQGLQQLAGSSTRVSVCWRHEHKFC